MQLALHEWKNCLFMSVFRQRALTATPAVRRRDSACGARAPAARARSRVTCDVRRSCETTAAARHRLTIFHFARRHWHQTQRLQNAPRDPEGRLTSRISGARCAALRQRVTDWRAGARCKKMGCAEVDCKHDGKPTRRGGSTRRTFGELLDGVDEGYDVIAAIRRLPKQVVVQDDSNGKGKAGYLDFGLKPA